MAVAEDKHDYLEATREKLFSALLTGSVKHFVDVLTDELANPVMVADQGYRIVARSEDHGQSHDYWRRVVRSSECNYDDYFENRTAIQKAFAQTAPVIDRASSSDGAIIESRIGSEAHIVGFMAVFECERPINASDLDVVQLACRCLALLLEREAAEPERPSEREALMLYRRAMRKDDSGRLAGPRLAEAVGVRRSDRYLLMKVCSADEGNPDLPSRLVRDRLERTIGNCRTWKTRSHVVALLGYSGEGPYESASARESLDKMLQQDGLCAGMSYPFFDLGNLRHASYQAGRALSMGRDTVGTAGSYRYCDLVNSDIAEIVSERLEIEDLVDPRLIRILRYDAAHQTDYLRSIGEVVRHNGNVSKACQTLNVHRNTLVYRLDRVRELFDLDVRDSNEYSLLIPCLSTLLFHAHGSFDEKGLRLLSSKVGE